MSWNFEEDFTEEYRSKVGNIYRENDKGELHSLHSPAFERPNGYKEWYQNDKRHRIDGPAIIFEDGHKLWYINGVRLSEAEFNQAVKLL